MSESTSGSIEVNLHHESHGDKTVTTSVKVLGLLIDSELVAIQANTAMDILLKKQSKE